MYILWQQSEDSEIRLAKHACPDICIRRWGFPADLRQEFSLYVYVHSLKDGPMNFSGINLGKVLFVEIPPTHHKKKTLLGTYYISLYPADVVDVYGHNFERSLTYLGTILIDL